METFKLDLLASIPHPKLIDYMLDSLVWMCIYGLAMSTTYLLLRGAWDSHFDAAMLGICIVVMMPSAWLMQRIVPASWLSYGKGLRYGSAQTSRAISKCSVIYIPDTLGERNGTKISSGKRHRTDPDHPVRKVDRL